MLLGCQTQRAGTDQCSGAGGSQRGPQAAVWRPTRASKNHCSSEGTLLRAFPAFREGIITSVPTRITKKKRCGFCRNGLFFLYYSSMVGGGTCTCHSECVEIKGQLVAVHRLLPPCGS